MTYSANSFLLIVRLGLCYHLCFRLLCVCVICFIYYLSVHVQDCRSSNLVQRALYSIFRIADQSFGMHDALPQPKGLTRVLFLFYML